MDSSFTKSSSKIVKEQIIEFLKEIPDPEIPVINIVELGIVRDIQISMDQISISITPTYMGCPAMKIIEDDIISILKSKGLMNIQIKTILSPSWTTDWISDEAKEKLKKYGIAPPERSSVDKGHLFLKGLKTIACPHCNSNNTEMKSQFGSTACKALYTCKDCLEPFDYFKCI